MSKHDENEDKRRRRFIGWIFGSVALAGLLAVGGFLLGNATASSAMGADNTNVIALPIDGCLDSTESATYLAAAYKMQVGSADASAAQSTSSNDLASTANGTPGASSDVVPSSGMSFDTAIAMNDDGADVTPASDPTATPDPTVTPDPTSTPDPAAQSGDDCDHSGHGEHDGHGDHEGHDSHHEDSHQSEDC